MKLMSSFCLLLLLLIGLEAKAGTSVGKNFGCNTSVTKVTYSSINVTWSPFNDSSSWQYVVHFWPLYANDSVVKANVTHSYYLATGLEPLTRYMFDVRDAIKDKDICRITARTTTSEFRDGLHMHRINYTTVFANWTQVKYRGSITYYRAFIEWGPPNNRHVYLVYDGPKTSTWVVKDNIPENFSFHVNVKWTPSQAGSSGSSPSSASVTSVTSTLDNARRESIAHNLTLILVSLGSNFVSIKWKVIPPNYIGNVTVQIQPNDTDHQITINKQTALIGKLQHDTAYQLHVQACNDSGNVVMESEWMDLKTEGLSSPSHCVSYHSDGVTWPKTKIGEEASQHCPHGGYGNVTRKCRRVKSFSQWEDPDYSECISEDIVSIHKLLQNHSNPVKYAQKLALATKVNRHKYSEDIKLIVDSLDILASKETIQQIQSKRGHTGTDTNDLAMSVLNISNGILDETALPSWKEIPMTSASSLANRLIQNLDNMAALLAANSGKRDVTAKTGNIALYVRKITSDSGDVDQRLTDIKDMRDGHASSVLFPGSVLKRQKIINGGVRFLSLVTYKTINKILQIDSTDGLTGSVQAPVVSVTLKPLNKNKFDKPVIITIVRSKKSAVNGEPTCAFLDISNSSSISWSSEGCHVGDYNETHTQCLCYHLTSFAVLMQVTDTRAVTLGEKHRIALSLISYIGLCTSILALLIVFLTFTLIRFLNLPRHMIHANLALSLALAHVTFLFGIDQTESKVVCKGLAISLHYLFLVSFTWMALEGVVLYLMLVKVFGSSMSTKKTKLIFMVCGWGIPAVIVGISSVVYHEGYGTDQFCWLSLNQEFIWAFVAPVLAVITFNFVCLGFTFYIMTKNSNRSSPKKKVDKLRFWLRSCCLLTCILGVTWVLGVFFVNKQTLVMAYLFSILNGFQGLMIFLLHCIGDRKIRTVYANVLRCHNSSYGLSSSGPKIVYRRDIARDSSSDQKMSPEKRFMKRGTVSSILRPPDALQAVEDSKERSENEQSDQSIDRKPELDREELHEITLTENHNDKASTPLLNSKLKHEKVNHV